MMMMMMISTPCTLELPGPYNKHRDVIDHGGRTSRCSEVVPGFMKPLALW